MWTKFTKIVAIIWSWFMSSRAAKEFVVYELNRLAKKTDNSVDDAAVQVIADKLGVNTDNNSNQ